MRALIVDDSPTAREMAAAALEDALDELELEAEVEIAPSGAAALKIVATGEVQLLLADLHMPDLTGLEVVRFWRQRTEGGMAVIVSTGLSEHDANASRAAGAAGFLGKPITAESLLSLLREHRFAGAV